MAIKSFGDLVGLLRAVKDEVVADRVIAVSAGVTFYAILALFPALTALISIFGLVASPAEVSGQIGALAGVLPAEAVTLLSEQATRIAAKANSTLSLAALIAVVLAIWSANGGIKALFEALGIAHSAPDTRGFIRLNLIALAFTLSGIVAMPILMAIVAALPVVLEHVAGGSVTAAVVLVLRWPVIIAILLAMLAVIYRYGPDLPDAEFRWISPGAVVAAIGLVVTSAGLSWYTSNFGSYDETYGSLAAMVVLMLWIWLSTVMVLVGAELNAELDRRAAPKPEPARAPQDGFSLPADA